MYTIIAIIGAIMMWQTINAGFRLGRRIAVASETTAISTTALYNALNPEAKARADTAFEVVVAAKNAATARQKRTNRLFALFIGIPLALFILIALALSAHAGDNSCTGTVTVVDAWAWIDDCTFKAASPAGKKILAACPHGSDCTVFLNLDKPRKGIKLKDIDFIEGPQKSIRLH